MAESDEVAPQLDLYEIPFIKAEAERLVAENPDAHPYQIKGAMADGLLKNVVIPFYSRTPGKTEEEVRNIQKFVNKLDAIPDEADRIEAKERFAATFLGDIKKGMDERTPFLGFLPDIGEPKTGIEAIDTKQEFIDFIAGQAPTGLVTQAIKNTGISIAQGGIELLDSAGRAFTGESSDALRSASDKLETGKGPLPRELDEESYFSLATLNPQNIAAQMARNPGGMITTASMFFGPVGRLTIGTIGSGVTFLQSAGDTIRNARAEGATDEQATAAGLTSASVQVATELGSALLTKKLFGNLQTTPRTKFLAERLEEPGLRKMLTETFRYSKDATVAASKILGAGALQTTNEITEELVANLGTRMINRVIYENDIQATDRIADILSKDPDNEELKSKYKESFDRLYRLNAEGIGMSFDQVSDIASQTAKATVLFSGGASALKGRQILKNKPDRIQFQDSPDVDAKVNLVREVDFNYQTHLQDLAKQAKSIQNDKKLTDDQKKVKIDELNERAVQAENRTREFLKTFMHMKENGITAEKARATIKGFEERLKKVDEVDDPDQLNVVVAEYEDYLNNEMREVFGDDPVGAYERVGDVIDVVDLRTGMSRDFMFDDKAESRMAQRKATLNEIKKIVPKLEQTETIRAELEQKRQKKEQIEQDVADVKIKFAAAEEDLKVMGELVDSLNNLDKEGDTLPEVRSRLVEAIGEQGITFLKGKPGTTKLNSNIKEVINSTKAEIVKKEAEKKKLLTAQQRLDKKFDITGKEIPLDRVKLIKDVTGKTDESTLTKEDVDKIIHHIDVLKAEDKVNKTKDNVLTAVKKDVTSTFGRNKKPSDIKELKPILKELDTAETASEVNAITNRVKQMISLLKNDPAKVNPFHTFTKKLKIDIGDGQIKSMRKLVPAVKKRLQFMKRPEEAKKLKNDLIASLEQAIVSKLAAPKGSTDIQHTNLDAFILNLNEGIMQASKKEAQLASKDTVKQDAKKMLNGLRKRLNIVAATTKPSVMRDADIGIKDINNTIKEVEKMIVGAEQDVAQGKNVDIVFRNILKQVQGIENKVIKSIKRAQKIQDAKEFQQEVKKKPTSQQESNETKTKDTTQESDDNKRVTEPINEQTGVIEDPEKEMKKVTSSLNYSSKTRKLVGKLLRSLPSSLKPATQRLLTNLSRAQYNIMTSDPTLWDRMDKKQYSLSQLESAISVLEDYKQMAGGTLDPVIAKKVAAAQEFFIKKLDQRIKDEDSLRRRLKKETGGISDAATLLKIWEISNFEDMAAFDAYLKQHPDPSNWHRVVYSHIPDDYITLTSDAKLQALQRRLDFMIEKQNRNKVETNRFQFVRDSIKFELDQRNRLRRPAYEQAIDVFNLKVAREMEQGLTEDQAKRVVKFEMFEDIIEAYKQIDEKLKNVVDIDAIDDTTIEQVNKLFINAYETHRAISNILQGREYEFKSGFGPEFIAVGVEVFNYEAGLNRTDSPTQGSVVGPLSIANPTNQDQPPDVQSIIGAAHEFIDEHGMLAGSDVVMHTTVPSWAKGATQAKGVVSIKDNKIHIIIPNITDKRDLEKVMRHESFGHIFLEGILGTNKWLKLVDSFSKVPAIRDRIADKVSKYKKAYRDLGSNRTATNFSDIHAVTELLAEYVEHTDSVKPLSFLGKMYGSIKIVLKDLLGLDYKVNDIQFLVRKAYAKFKTGKKTSVVEALQDTRTKLLYEQLASTKEIANSYVLGPLSIMEKFHRDVQQIWPSIKKPITVYMSREDVVDAVHDSLVKKDGNNFGIELKDHLLKYFEGEKNKIVDKLIRDFPEYKKQLEQTREVYLEAKFDSMDVAIEQSKGLGKLSPTVMKDGKLSYARGAIKDTMRHYISTYRAGHALKVFADLTKDSPKMQELIGIDGTTMTQQLLDEFERNDLPLMDRGIGLMLNDEMNGLYTTVTRIDENGKPKNERVGNSLMQELMPFLKKSKVTGDDINNFLRHHAALQLHQQGRGDGLLVSKKDAERYVKEHKAKMTVDGRTPADAIKSFYQNIAKVMDSSGAFLDDEVNAMMNREYAVEYLMEGGRTPATTQPGAVPTGPIASILADVKSVYERVASHKFDQHLYDFVSELNAEGVTEIDKVTRILSNDQLKAMDEEAGNVRNRLFASNLSSLKKAIAKHNTDNKGNSYLYQVVINGVPRVMEIKDPLLAKAIDVRRSRFTNNISSKGEEIVEAVFSKLYIREIANFKRSTIILTPMFIAKNLLTDVFTVAMRGQVSHTMMLKVAAKMLNPLDGTYRNQMERILTDLGHFDAKSDFAIQNSPQEAAKQAEKFIRKNLMQGDKISSIKKLGSTVANVLQETLKVTELLSRSALYEEVMRSHDKLINEKGISKIERQKRILAVSKRAGAEARDLMNFRQFGTNRTINSLLKGSAFARVGVTAIEKDSRVIMEVLSNPKTRGRFLRNQATMMALTAFLATQNAEDEEYKNLPWYVKVSFFRIRMGDGVVYIPKPFGITSALFNLTELAITAAYDTDEAGELGKHLAGDVISKALPNLPVVGDLFSSTLGGMLGLDLKSSGFNLNPDLLNTFTQIVSNRNQLTGAPIIPLHKMGDDFETRDRISGKEDPLTLQMARAIGFVSPAQLHFAISDLSGPLFDITSNVLSGPIIGGAKSLGLVDPKARVSSIDDIFTKLHPIKNAITEAQSGTFQRFYKLRDEIERKINSLKTDEKLNPSALQKVKNEHNRKKNQYKHALKMMNSHSRWMSVIGKLTEKHPDFHKKSKQELKEIAIPIQRKTLKEIDRVKTYLKLMVEK